MTPGCRAAVGVAEQLGFALEGPGLIQAVASRDRLLHYAEILTMDGPSRRLHGRGDRLKQRAKNREAGPTDLTSPPG